MEDIKSIKKIEAGKPAIKPADIKVWLAWVSFFSKRPNLWLICSIILLALVGLSFFGLGRYKADLEKKNRVLSEELANLEGQRDPELEKDFIGLKKRIEGFKVFLSNRVYSSLVFVLLEELILPQVQLTGLDIDLSLSKMTAGVEALDYTALGKQIFALEKDERVKKVNPAAINLNTSGRVSSNLEIELDSEFLHSKNITK